MPTRVIHTSDVHLDMSFASGALGPEKGRLKREAIRTTFSRIIDDCLAWPAHMLVIAGDLFEEDRVSPDTIGYVKRQFDRLKGIPVVIAPGNHDPYTVGGRYSVTQWGANVHIFNRSTQDYFAFESLGVTVHGIAHNSRHMQGRLAALSTPVASGGASILVAHASDETNVPADKSADDVWLPFTAEEIGKLGFSYAALGHYHTSYDISAGGRVVAAYAGAPEGLRFSEDGPRQYARVTIDKRAAKIERRSVSQIDLLTFEVLCDGFKTRAEFFDAVSALAVKHPGQCMVRVKALGRVAPGFDISAGVPDDVRSRFFHLVLDDQTQAAYDWAAIEGERTLRGEVARRLADQMKDASPEEMIILEKARLYAMDSLSGDKIEPAPEVLRVD